MNIIPMMDVRIVGYTIPTIENHPEIKTISDFILYIAKVSNPEKQHFLNYKLIDYLIDNKHWSPFQMANIVVEIEAPRDISRQILRHQTMSAQEFSQRYAEVQNFCIREIRSQDKKNRQNSNDTFTATEKLEFEEDCRKAIEFANALYHKWRDREGAKECCRVFLPEGLTMSRLYINATVRTWLHYLSLREKNGTQKEHSSIANAIRELFIGKEPLLFETPV